VAQDLPVNIKLAGRNLPGANVNFFMAIGHRQRGKEKFYYADTVFCGLYYKHILTIVNDASTINVIDDASLALASVVNYDHK
jgi:hypothetical protein